ncbi:MAG: SpoIIE family protein phosphatase [Eubacteriales bacterium]
MRRQEQVITLLPDYGKRKLLSYADSFKELADTFLYLTKEETQALSDCKSRQDYITQRRMIENRGLLADHLNEISFIMTRIAEESYRFIRLSDKQMKKISEVLKNHGIYLDDLYIREARHNQIEITTKMKTVATSTFTIEEIAGVLSVVLNKRIVPTIGVHAFLTSELQTVIFEEESKYATLTGMASAIKECEHQSGDNHSILQLNNGTLMALLSDGMGAGEKAHRDSEEVIELMEKLLEAGFSKEMAIQIVNGVLIASSERENMSTLDLCELDLYTGAVVLLKVGSSLTYVKRKHSTEQLESTTLPLGVFSELEVEPITTQVRNGEYIILISDGILDAICQGNFEYELADVIQELEIQNPQEMANYLLRYAIEASNGRIKDDMSVLVIGVWDTYGECEK